MKRGSKDPCVHASAAITGVLWLGADKAGNENDANRKPKPVVNADPTPWGDPVPTPAPTPIPTPSANERVVEWTIGVRDVPELSRVHLVVDNSARMAKHQTQLSQGMAKVVDALAGKNVDFALHTTAELGQTTNLPLIQYGNNTPHFQLPNGQVLGHVHLGWADPAGFGAKPGSRIKAGVGYRKGSGGALIPWSPADFAAHGPTVAWPFGITKSLFPSDSDVLSLRDTMGPSDVALTKEKLSAAVSGVGIYGSPSNSPLCNLARAPSEQGDASLFANTKRAASIILSDADDSGRPCYKQIERDIVAKSGGDRASSPSSRATCSRATGCA